MNKTRLHVSVTPLWPLPVYTHHALLITCISAEHAVISPAISGIKQPYSAARSYLPLIALIAGAALRITLPLFLIKSLRFKTKGADRSTTVAGERGGFHPAVGRGIFTQLLRTEYQVAAGKTFVVP